MLIWFTEYSHCFPHFLLPKYPSIEKIERRAQRMTVLPPDRFNNTLAYLFSLCIFIYVCDTEPFDFCLYLSLYVYIWKWISVSLCSVSFPHIYVSPVSQTSSEPLLFLHYLPHLSLPTGLGTPQKWGQGSHHCIPRTHRSWHGIGMWQVTFE